MSERPLGAGEGTGKKQNYHSSRPGGNSLVNANSNTKKERLGEPRGEKLNGGARARIRGERLQLHIACRWARVWRTRKRKQAKKNGRLPGMFADGLQKRE